MRLHNRQNQFDKRRNTIKTRLILVGGFLGAGKTTLLWDVAQRLSNRGLKVGLITNDQAPELVDTAFLSRGDVNVSEVSGSCFCCDFQGLLDAIAKLQTEAQADVIIAEPVGSCTDLSATIIQPLKERFQGGFVVAPLSVMTDPVRLADILDGGTAGLHPSAAYIFRKQIEEADIIVISKTDLLSTPELRTLMGRVAQEFPDATVSTISTKGGEGIDLWLDGVLKRSDSGTHLAEIDYDVYAEGEAVLGWLNATIALQGKLTDWNVYVETLLNNLSQRFDSMSASVGHVKVMITVGDSFLIGNLTGKGDTLSISGSVVASCESRLIINARVQMSPEELDTIVREMITSTGSGYVVASPVAWRCLRPGRPNPTHRYDHVVTVKEA